MLDLRSMFADSSNSSAKQSRTGTGGLPPSSGCWLQSPTFDILNTCRPERFCSSLAQANFVAGCSFLMKEQRNRTASTQVKCRTAVGADFRQETGAHFLCPSAHFNPTAATAEDAWISLAHEDQVGRRRAEPSPCHRPQACCCQRRIPRLSLSRRFVSAGQVSAPPFSGQDTFRIAMSIPPKSESETLAPRARRFASRWLRRACASTRTINAPMRPRANAVRH